MKTSTIWIVVIIIIAVAGWYLFFQPNMDGVSNIETAEQAETPTENGAAISEQDAVKIFDISGKNFEFSTKEIRVKKGDTVTINFTSAGGFHDWKIDKFNAATQRVEEGNTSSVTFTADTSGTFEYYCSVGSHRQLGMVGSLIVEE
ncbi:MAG: hypothetical protein COW88_00725 [Candidatus Lloydbacteria bacterium CG22_combo_CG10-13_8_21_14_all_47_15]|uniref:Blue (type 1) copper domain-containing protein n=1 Tax=Candidatus Lloydbacteria bacterium CG22_combo_CG10-13_8_21_14_all_47_15 TaxID=1974635 RepID=A0A2H0CVA8_9BACT|nr:MAG: hypothetical protein COW88_00725 [Candidatus Lloydbacteria bacterium CG22_combo_CG10-13_8_21_14_all_47_15]